jgi:hypothetical protein
MDFFKGVKSLFDKILLVPVNQGIVFRSVPHQENTMKILSILVCFCAVSCTLFQQEIGIREVITERQNIDATDNPARRMLMNRQLQDKKIVLKDILVKEIVDSTNIDFDFCVIADIAIEGKEVECFIYSKNTRVVADLVSGKTRIDVDGTFNRFLTVLDDYHAKIEIINARIVIR